MSDPSRLQTPSKPFARIVREPGHWLIPLILIAAPTLVYWPILHNEFVSLDDQITIYQNPYFQRLTFGGICSFWVGPYMGLYAPIPYTLLAIISVFSRAKFVHGHRPPFQFYPAPFHAFDLLLHVANVLLVYRLLRRFVRKPWPAAAGALLFALHPVQVESVAWASETSNLLCAFFSLSAVLLYLRSAPGDPIDPSPLARRARRSNYMLGVESLVLAMGSKPLGVIVPLLAMIAHWLWRRQMTQKKISTADPPPPIELKRRRWNRWRASPRPILLWLALAIPFTIVARVGQPVPAWWLVVPIWFRPFVAADALAFYLYKIIFPVRLLADYDRSPRVLLEHGWWHITWIVPAVSAAGLVWLRRKKKADAVVAGAMWFVASLLPVLGFTLFAFQHSSTVADRYLYLPMVGVALIAAWALDQVPAAAQTHSDFTPTGGSRDILSLVAEGASPGIAPTGPRAFAIGYQRGISKWAATRSRRAGVRRVVRLASLAGCTVILSLLGIRTFFQTDYWHDTLNFFAVTREAIHRRPGAMEEEDIRHSNTAPQGERYFGK
ncbi:MAG TPA: hypothetical protein VG326_01195 [Tepidisphaeraceae bacterium]|nr:hypothetical protein [Tepidisphaeraceae bacterium]